MDANLLSNVLRYIRNNEGCSTNDLYRGIPELLRIEGQGDTKSTRLSILDFSIETIQQLVNWGLVEPWSNGKLLNPKRLEKKLRRLSHPSPLENLLINPILGVQYIHKRRAQITFYTSRSLLEMEEFLGLKFDATPFSIFPKSYSELVRSDVFVVMPFTKNLEAVYKNHIKKVCLRLKLSVTRADDFFSHGVIMSEIYTAIRQAKIIIADCTRRNANVFYEIGLSHGIGKDVIFISQSTDDIPFDLSHRRFLIYDPAQLQIFEDSLYKTLKAITQQHSQLP